MEAEVKTEFEAINQPIEKPLVGKCVSLCQQFGFTPSELALRWGTYVLNHDVSAPTAPLLDHFQREIDIQKKQTVSSVGRSGGRSSKVYDKKSVREVESPYSAANSRRSSGGKITLSGKRKSPASAFESSYNNKRGHASPASPFVASQSVGSPFPSEKTGKILSSYNLPATPTTPAPATDDDTTASSDVPLSSATSRLPVVQLPADRVCSPYLIMSDRAKDRAEALDTRRQLLGASIVSSYDLDEPALFSIPCQEKVVAIGRVCTEVDPKISSSSVVLEGSRDRVPFRVRLDLRDIDEYSLFPGQIIAAEGVNSTGKRLVASSIFTPEPLPLSTSLSTDLPKSLYAKKDASANPLHMVVTSGPYTHAKDIDYHPLKQLLKMLTTERKGPAPGLVVMCGPFVDRRHVRVRGGQITTTFEEYFAEILSEIVKTFAKELPDTQLVVVPSIHEAHINPVFPQPPYDIDIGTSAKIHLVPNPCVLEVDDFTIGVSTNDVLKHLAGNITTKHGDRTAPKDRVGELCKHVVEQRSFYPLWPAAEGSMIDTTKFNLVEFGSCTPDLLILNSDLTNFVKPTLNALCVNPGRCTLGSMAKITVKSVGKEAPKDTPSHHFLERASVEIIHL